MASLWPVLPEEPMPSTSFNDKENIQGKTVGPCTSEPLSQTANRKTTTQTSAARRYDTSIKQTEKLVDVTREDCKSRKLYYIEKINFYKQKIVLKERSVVEKQRMCSALEGILKKYGSQ